MSEENGAPKLEALMDTIDYLLEDSQGRFYLEAAKGNLPVRTILESNWDADETRMILMIRKLITVLETKRFFQK